MTTRAKVRKRRTFHVPSTNIVLVRCIGGWSGQIDDARLAFRKGTRGHYRWVCVRQGVGDVARGVSLTALVWAVASHSDRYSFDVPSFEAWANPWCLKGEA